MSGLSIFNYIQLKLSKAERSLVMTVTFSSIFEWFEFFLFVYWSRIFEEEAHFSGLAASAEELVYAALLLLSGLLSRPLGGIIFGRMGDKKGRRVAFMRSVVWIILPSLILTFAPSFSTWAYSALISLAVMRLLQGIPAGGELPGALCLLYEGSHHTRRKYICSYLFVGTHLGQICSLLLIFTLKACLTHAELIDWGWRLSFGISSVIGIVGGLLRKKIFHVLNETEEFKQLKTEHRVEAHPLRSSFKNHKKNIFIVLFLSIFEVSGFYLIYYYLFERPDLLNMSPFQSNMSYLLCLLFIVIATPVIGSVKNVISIDRLFKISAIGVMVTCFPFFFAIENDWPVFSVFLLLLIMTVLFCIQFSFLPSFIAALFPTEVRFTCIGFSFNITDGVIGGIIPLFATWLVKGTGLESLFLIVLPISALIFLFCLKLIKNENRSCS